MLPFAYVYPEKALSFEKIEKKKEVVEFIKQIRAFCCKHDVNQEWTWEIANSIEFLMYYNQQPDISNDQYHQQFRLYS